MMRHCILACCVAATLFAGFLSQARAQWVGEPPAPGDTMAAYRAVDGWVREWNVGGGEVKAGEAPVPPCEAASVTLRLAGEVIGRGIEVASDPAQMAGIIAAATRAAMKEAEPKLGIPRDAMYETTVKDVAKRVTISLQLAGTFIPISPKDAAEAMVMVSPGVEGVAVRLGGQIAANFPERMLTTGTEPGPALGTLVGKLADDATLAVEPLSKLAKDKGAVFYRFRVSHLAQPKAGETPVFLHRCGRVVSRGMMDEAELRRWAAELAASLLNQRGVGTSGSLFRQNYNPLSGHDEQSIAAPVVQLICVDALGYWRAHATENERAQLRSAFKGIFADLLADLAIREKILNDPAASGLMYSETFSAAMFDDVIDAAQLNDDFLQTCQARPAAAFNEQDGFDPKLQAADRAMVCLGLMLSSPLIEDSGPVARAAITRAYREAGQRGLIALMPWLGQADIVLSGVEFRRNIPDMTERLATPLTAGPLASAVALRDMRSQLWAHQLQPDALSPDQQDLAGGILFTSTRQPMPTWQMARPLAFIATMLGDPRLTEDKEVPEELSRLLLSLRFLRQLTAGETEGFMYKNSERAMGGVRSSLWDQRMPPEATAMTLMTVCETLRSMEEIRKRREGK